MKYLMQFGIIALVSMAGELLRELLPFSIPGSIYGLVLMLVLLMTKIIKVEQVKDAGNFLLDIMPVLFIPSSVGLIVSWGTMKDIVVPVLLVCIMGTIIVMATVGIVTQHAIAVKNKKEVRKLNNKEGI